MKKSFLFLTLIWLSLSAICQSPQGLLRSFGGINYQTVIRDGDGQPVVNTAITLKMFIRAEAANGTIVYSETHAKVSNSFGLVNLIIGQGTPVAGQFETINWGSAAHFLETSFDADGSGNYVVLGVTQFLSVPYALNSQNGMPDGTNTGDLLYWNGTAWTKVAAGINGQVLTLNNGIPVWGGIQLPILITTTVGSITATSATCGGNIASDGGSPVIARGLCWNTAPNPTIANSKTINGSGTGSFSASMTQLAASTVYYVRAYATNSAGTSYGNEVSFTTTNGSITLTTTAITAITLNSATSGGNITNNGGVGVSARGVCWNTAPYPTTANSKTTNGSGNGAFVSELTGLAPNTLYYVRAYATNSLGTSYGNQQSFTTQNGIITLTTAEVTEITATTAISGGEITNDGGSPVTVRGVCFSTSQNPTISDSTTTDGSGNGAFVSNLTNLLPDTLYYVRAYATNGVGTYYGNEESFETLAWQCGDVLVDERDGQEYNTVQIGDQCWMVENLNVGTRVDGVQNQTNNGAIEKYCYDNLETNCDVYGGLYQWDEMMGYTIVQGCQGICPNGWYLPTNNDWDSLTTYACNQATNRCNNNVDFIAKALAATTNWNATSSACAPGNNLAANNATGFTALPGGSEVNDSFNGAGYNGHWWTSTQDSQSSAWRRKLVYSDAYVGIYSGGNKSWGFSVRCIKNH